MARTRSATTTTRSGTKRVVCDQETALANAVRARWPGIAVTISPWHLQRQAFKRLRRAKRHAPDDILFDRRDAFRNRRRTDLLLDLITLKLLGKDDERVYSRIIREVVYASHGRGGTRGKICDPAGSSSLRPREAKRAA